MEKSFTHLVPYAGEHAVERTLSALKPLALKQYVTETTMSYRPEHWENMRQQLKQLGVARQYVVIQPTARQLFKCWDNDKFSQVIDAVQRRGYQVVLTSGPPQTRWPAWMLLHAAVRQNRLLVWRVKLAFLNWAR